MILLGIKLNFGHKNILRVYFIDFRNSTRITDEGSEYFNEIQSLNNRSWLQYSSEIHIFLLFYQIIEK